MKYQIQGFARGLLAVGVITGLGCAARTPVTHTVTIRNFAFVAPTISAQAGDTIAWVNEDAVPHTATGDGKLDSGAIESRGRWRYVTLERGSLAYRCVYHPTMTGTIIVK